MVNVLAILLLVLASPGQAAPLSQAQTRAVSSGTRTVTAPPTCDTHCRDAARREATTHPK